jgi:hypothetical protein
LPKKKDPAHELYFFLSEEFVQNRQQIKFLDRHNSKESIPNKKNVKFANDINVID